MTQEEKIEMLVDLFEIESAQLKETTILTSLNWDSMNMLALIVLFKSELDKKLDPAQLHAFKTVGDILKAMD